MAKRIDLKGGRNGRLTPETIIDTYDKRLRGEIKQFPPQTWSPHNGGYDNLHRCLRYFFLEKLNYNREDLVNKVSLTLMRKSKLNGGVAILYGDSLRKAMTAAFKDFDIKEWEYRGYEWMPETAREALLFEISRLCLTKEDITKPRFIEHDNYIFSRVLIWYNTVVSSGGILPMLQFLLPEFEFKRSEFNDKSRVSRDKDDAKFAIRNVFENVLKWDENDIKEKITLNIVKKHLAIPYRTFGQNIENMVKVAYPNIGELNIFKPIPQDVRDKIIAELRSGEKHKNISKKYGISLGTITNIKKESGASE